MKATSFTLIYDTYCGWCYGAAPVFNTLLEAGAEINCYHLRLFHGANALYLDKASAARIASYDRRIAALTAQPFGEPYFRRVLDTEAEPLDSGLTAKAAALASAMGAHTELALAHKLQRERYVNGNAPGNIEIVLSALQDVGVKGDRTQLREQLRTSTTVRRTKDRAERAEREMRTLGAAGVPCLIAHSAERSWQVELTQYLGKPSDILHLLT